jgi:hypothetical protein
LIKNVTQGGGGGLKSAKKVLFERPLSVYDTTNFFFYYIINSLLRI